MPTIPSTKVLTTSTVDILNVIRNNASIDYQNYVPLCDESVESLRNIGNVLCNYVSFQNEFINALVNKIAFTYIKSKSYTNPFSIFKRGIIEIGETIEEIFVNLANVYEFDRMGSTKALFEHEEQNVVSMFHTMNFKKYYTVELSEERLKTAFTSFNNLIELINELVNSVYKSANYDEQITTTYLIGKAILNGRNKPIEIPSTTKENVSDIVTKIKAVSDDFTFLSKKYNISNVYNHSEKTDQYLLVTPIFNASMNVEVLSQAFNMSKSEFNGHTVLIPAFNDIDNARLKKLFGINFVPFTEEELSMLSKVPAILVDKDYFMIFDNLIRMDEQNNAVGLFKKYFYHIWKTFSISPFENSAVFVEETPQVISITATPSNATVTVNSSVAIAVDVKTKGFAPKTVVFESDNENITVNRAGVVTVLQNAKTGDVANINITSSFNSEIKTIVKITVA